MNWRYLVGDIVNRAVQAALSSRVMPLTRYVPPGQFWVYDVQRFAGTRDLTVVFDVGANVGQTAYGLVRYLPNSKIFCVEPVAATMQILKARCARHKNICFVQAAFGSRRETTSMRLHTNSELNTLIEDQPRVADLTGQTEIVTVETIDNFCRDRAIDRIDLLKIDVQGWELEVLRGAKMMLSRNSIWFVIAEVGFRKSDTDMQPFAELNEFMQISKFDFCGFYDTYRYGPAKQFVGFSNALYVNTNFVHVNAQSKSGFGVVVAPCQSTPTGLVGPTDQRVRGPAKFSASMVGLGI
jgi:FkbM family methyltransferase